MITRAYVTRGRRPGGAKFSAGQLQADTRALVQAVQQTIARAAHACASTSVLDQLQLQLARSWRKAALAIASYSMRMSVGWMHMLRIPWMSTVDIPRPLCIYMHMHIYAYELLGSEPHIYTCI